MITRCPECGTKFRISVDLIRAEDPTVRCGDCMSVFDARAQLVDEATESSYLVDSARQRSVRSHADNQQRRATDQTGSDAIGSETARTIAANYSSSARARDRDHSPGFYRRQIPGYGGGQSDQQSNRQGSGQGSGQGNGQNDGQGNGQSNGQGQSPSQRAAYFDQRESVTDIDLDEAETVAFDPVDRDVYGARSESDTGTLLGRRQLTEDYSDHTQSRQSVEQPSRHTLDLDLTEQEAARPVVAENYSQRIDPFINPDDKSIEFERTLALDGVTGVEQNYTEQGISERDDRNYPDRSYRERETDNRYIGEHQLPAASQMAEESVAETQNTNTSTHHEGVELRTPRTKLRRRVDYSNDPDIINPSVAPPRSERHLDGNSSNRSSNSASQNPSQSNLEASAHRNRGQSAIRDETPSQGSVTRENFSDSATSMRQHVSERGVAIDSDEDYEVVSERPSHSKGWLLLLLLSVAIAAAYLYRDNIANSNLPEPVRAAFCAVSGCDLPVAKDLSSLELLRQKVYSHPNIDNALVISVDVINHAAFPQPYPVLAITMANSKGESVAQRDFEPVAYLENYTGDETLAAGKPTRINIDVVDPGEDAQSFEMEFR